MKNSDPTKMGEKQKMSPMIAIAYCLESVSRLQCREKKPKKRPAGSLNCG